MRSNPTSIDQYIIDIMSLTYVFSIDFPAFDYNYVSPTVLAIPIEENLTLSENYLPLANEGS
jgi:hypothetical protein